MVENSFFPPTKKTRNFSDFLSSRDHFAGVFRAASTSDRENSFLDSTANENSNFSSESRVAVEVCGSCRVDWAR